MAINYDQREVKKFELDPNFFDYSIYGGDWTRPEAYVNNPQDSPYTQEETQYGILKNLLSSGTPSFDYNNAAYGQSFEKPYVKDYYSNRDIYNAEFNRNKSFLADYLGIGEEDSNAINNILYSYNPEQDYRTGLQQYDTEGTRSISSDPQKQAALDYIAEAQGFKKTARRKSFQGATLAGLLAFAGGAAGLAAGAGGTAAAGAGGTAAGTGGGTAVGGAGGAVAGGAPAASGGLFVGSGGFLGGTGSALADAALNSAIQSGLTSAISGGNPLKGALTGGLTGGFGNAIGGFDFGLGDAGNAALAAALKGGLSSGISGGNPLLGAALAGGGSALGSAFNGGFDFGGADGGPNGYQLPEEYNPDSNFDFTNSINNPLSGSGGNVGLFDDIFNSDANYDFTNSISPNIFDQLTSGDNGGFNFYDYLGGNDSIDLGGLYDSSNSTSFLDQLFPGATSDDQSINSYLDQIFKESGQTIDLANSSGPQIQQALSQLAPDTIQNLVTKYGSKLVSALLGGGSGSGGLGGLAGLLSGNGGNFGQTLGSLTSGVLTNSQKKAIEGARDTSVNLADPFRQQRPQYQQQLATLLSNPGSISSSPAFQGIYDLGLEAVNRNASAKGQLNSGNRLAALSDYGQKTASQYYFPQAQLLSNLAGVNAGSPATAAGINLAGTESAQGLRSKQAADFVGGLTGFTGNQQNDTLQRALLGLFGDKGI